MTIAETATRTGANERTEPMSISRWERALLVLGAGAYEEPHIQWACAEVLQRERIAGMTGGHAGGERVT